ncbi:MAG: fibronectin type III domain-containing protein [Candidatus Cloacimonadaceae bacterium]
MKKLFIITAVVFLAIGLYGTKPRSYTQLLINDFDGGLLPGVTNDAYSTAPDYQMTAYVTSRPQELLTTDKHKSFSIRVWRLGNGTSFPYVTCAYLQFGAFWTNWEEGDTIRFSLKHIPTGDQLNWELVIPDSNASAIGYKQRYDPIPFLVGPPYKEVPNPVTFVAPDDGSKNIAANSLNLVWKQGPGRTPEGYKVYLDTKNPPKKMVADQMELVYTVSGLQAGKTYYWQIVPYTKKGDAKNCPVWSFSLSK